MTNVYLVTGAGSGLGWEAVRQLIDLPSTARVYALARSPPPETHPKVNYIEWDASRPTENLPDGVTFDGVLLNAGGQGPNMVQINLLGHAALMERLSSQTKCIVASGSEAPLGVPVPVINWNNFDVDQHLDSTKNDGVEYVWVKAMVALYWSAYARRHTDCHVATVSPGATTGTNFFRGVPWALRCIAKSLIAVYGSHGVEEGARRYVEFLTGEREDVASGCFWASRKGYTEDFGDVLDHRNGSHFGNEGLQDRVYEAVQKRIRSSTES